MSPPPLKRLGQNFLSDPSILSRIVDVLQLAPGECVVEIGAGRGGLTAELARRAERVVAIEVDRLLVPVLNERFAGAENVRIVEGDALELSFGDLAAGPYKLVGNVPYYITTPLIFHALDAPRPELSVYLVQKEVAQRAAAEPGSRTYGALSVNLQALAEVEMLFTVPPGAFRPRPTVDSAVMRLRPRREVLVPPGCEGKFRVFVQSAFGQRRKQLRRIMRATWSLSASDSDALIERCGIDPAARPETLSPSQFMQLLAAATELCK